MKVWEQLLTGEVITGISVLFTAVIAGIIKLASFLADMKKTINKVNDQVSNSHSTNFRDDMDLHKEALIRIESKVDLMHSDMGSMHRDMDSMHSDVTELSTQVTRERTARERGDKAIREELDQIMQDGDRTHTSMWQKLQGIAAHLKFDGSLDNAL